MIRSRRNPAYGKLIWREEEDPLEGMANLFDIGIVFALALMLALVSYYHLPELIKKESVVILKNPGKPNMELIRKKGIKIEKYRITSQSLGGEGKKLGTCYQLKNGEVVYVPEK